VEFRHTRSSHSLDRTSVERDGVIRGGGAFGPTHPRGLRLEPDRDSARLIEAGAGLVDLVVCVGCHRSGGHEFAIVMSASRPAKWRACAVRASVAAPLAASCSSAK
jgi:hypothetical protein